METKYLVHRISDSHPEEAMRILAEHCLTQDNMINELQKEVQWLHKMAKLNQK